MAGENTSLPEEADASNKETSSSKKAPAKKPRDPRKTTPKKTTAKATQSSLDTDTETVPTPKQKQNMNQNNQVQVHILYGVVIFLLLLLVGAAYYIGSLKNTSSSITQTPTTGMSEDITITVIDDARCSDCLTEEFVSQLETVPSLSEAEYVFKDFSDNGVAEYLEENNISALPAVIFNTVNLYDGGAVSKYLLKLPNGEFSLNVGASFDPFVTRSENGFLVTEQSVIDDIAKYAYYTGNTGAPISWIEFSDVNCYYCKKMASDETSTKVLAQFPEALKHSYFGFIGVGGAATQTAMETIECVGMLAGDEAYSYTFEQSLVQELNDNDSLLSFAEQAGADRQAVEACVTNGDAKEQIEAKFNIGVSQFGITGTPGNVLLNNLTGEYEVISGAYPEDAFVDAINRLLGN